VFEAYIEFFFQNKQKMQKKIIIKASERHSEVKFRANRLYGLPWSLNNQRLDYKSMIFNLITN